MVKRVSRKKPGKFAIILLGSWYDKRRRRPPETEGSCIYTDSRQEMVLQETGREAVDWTNLAQDTDKWLALVNTVMKLRFPHNAGKCLTSRRTISSSTRTKLHWVGWKISQKRPVCSVIDFPYVSSVLINNSIILENRGKVTEFSFKIRKLPSWSLAYVL
jgi:hypothetical protein